MDAEFKKKLIEAGMKGSHAVLFATLIDCVDQQDRKIDELHHRIENLERESRDNKPLSGSDPHLGEEAYY